MTHIYRTLRKAKRIGLVQLLIQDLSPYPYMDIYVCTHKNVYIKMYTQKWHTYIRHYAKQKEQGWCSYWFEICLPIYICLYTHKCIHVYRTLRKAKRIGLVQLLIRDQAQDFQQPKTKQFPVRLCVVCCSVLPCVAVCGSVLQCVAWCCSVLQCVAVCCSVPTV